ncbi:aminotransferase class V-fold PLP-dependent enzyme [Thalassotalea sp. 1_MG-2023]|uniref:aminotransferase class V-fold PLP-dependent enzyme n=1 Tax=Thalassotalea sp. 1_MG-2023 TaxID=3062680 RepID=UPI0026E219BE|nr:aminotransferase class V-fold PLP-dependent enzyme [Thalassotalea sp. 1_MG-2023]MDO6425499.1 aminotransferase class V-fold PLP-dependent enzyme [Thalassotalea sp. 1_MG-2023]
MIKVRVCQWGFKEWWILFTALVSSHKKAPERLKDRLARYFHREIVLFNSGRAAIALCLQFVRQTKKGKTEVIIPRYICTSVIETIEKCGFQAIHAPVNDELNLDITALPAFISDRTAAIIAPHMYSCSADIEAIASLSREKNIFLIDDAAQVFGVKHAGSLLGTFGNAGVLSFAQAKSIVTGIKGSGGALLISDPELKRFVDDNVASYERNRVSFSRIVEFLCVYKWRGIFETAHYYLDRIKTLLQVNKPTDDYEPRKIAYLDAAIALRQVDTFNQRYSQTLQRLAIYQRELSQLPFLSLPQIANETRYVSRFIVRLASESPKAFRQYLKEHGVASKLTYLNGSKLYDGTADSGLLELPLQDISTADVQKVCNVCQQYSKHLTDQEVVENNNVTR